MRPMKSGTSGARLLTLLVAATAVAVVCVAPVVTASLLAEDEANTVRFAAFKRRHGKVYATLEEEAHRLRVFKENMADARRMNAANPHATFGVTQFSDLTREEFKAKYTMDAKYVAPALRNAVLTVNVTGTAPPSIDWRERGAVTPVKDQARCGSCWAFSTIGAIESQVKIAGGELKRLSEQQLVSCDTLSGACRGGLMGWALRYIVEQNDGNVYTEDSYPYASGGGNVPPCDPNNRVVGAKVKGFEQLPKDEEKMAAYLAQNGPLAIAMDTFSLAQYNGGIITKCRAVQTDHAVVLVGYNDESNPPYWIIKNSWSARWGEEGYLRIKKGVNACLVTNYVIAARLVDKSA